MPKTLIKQTTLRAILDARAHLRDLRAECKRVEDQLAKDEAVAIFQIDRGDPCERGPLTAGITVEAGARRPAWKEEFARTCGPAAVEAIIARTPAPERRTLTIMEDKR